MPDKINYQDSIRVIEGSSANYQTEIEVLKKEFPECFKLTKSKLDECLKVIKGENGVELKIAINYHDGTNPRIVYFNQQVNETELDGRLAGLEQGKELLLRIRGKNISEVAKKLGKQLYPQEPETAENEYIHREVVVSNKLGLHARPSAMFVTEAFKHESAIYVRRKNLPLSDEHGTIKINGKTYVDGKSIIGLFTLAASKGTILEIIAKGNGAEGALNSLEALVNSKFEED